MLPTELFNVIWIIKQGVRLTKKKVKTVRKKIRRDLNHTRYTQRNIFTYIKRNKERSCYRGDVNYCGNRAYGLEHKGSNSVTKN